MRSPWARRSLILLVLTVIATAIRLTVFRPQPVPVTVFRVAPGRVEETVTNSKAGTVKTRREASLSPEMGGRIEALPVKKGDRVHRGQLLLRIAAADMEAEATLQARSLDAHRPARRGENRLDRPARESRHRTPMAAFQTLLRLGSQHQPTTYKQLN